MQTIRPEDPSDNPIYVAAVYLKSEFLIDLIATVPTIILHQNYQVFSLRILHSHELSKSQYSLTVLLEKLFPNSRITRINIGSIIKFGYSILLGVHYIVCLWIWIGDKYLMHDLSNPWMIQNPGLDGQSMYFFVAYWVFTIITTVGYGDFVGNTTAEYLVSLIIELTGLIVFSILNILME